jgi:hypothetical protein
VRFSQSAEDFSGGNSLKLVDWSADGTKLLLERTQWKYESEGDYTDIVIFDANSMSASRPDVEAAIAAEYGKECGSENSAQGFTRNGKVVLTVGPLTDQLAIMNGAKSCVPGKTRLVLDISNETIQRMEPLSDQTKLVQNGHFITSAPN